MRRGLPIALALAALLAGCHTGEKACRDLRDAYKQKLMECLGYTEEEAQEAFKEELAEEGGESCQDVDDLRDPDQFWEECLPRYEESTCEELAMEDDELDEACEDQLILIDPPGA